MKKALIIFALVCTSQISWGQNTQSTLYAEATLNAMSKLKLAEIYLQQVDQMAQSMPYTAFTLPTGTPSDSLRGQLDIPQSKYIKDKRERVQKVSLSYGTTLREELAEIIPYSDKADIVRAIIYLQGINTMMRKPTK